MQAVENNRFYGQKITFLILGGIFEAMITAAQGFFSILVRNIHHFSTVVFLI